MRATGMYKLFRKKKKEDAQPSAVTATQTRTFDWIGTQEELAAEAADDADLARTFSEDATRHFRVEGFPGEEEWSEACLAIADDLALKGPANARLPIAWLELITSTVKRALLDPILDPQRISLGSLCRTMYMLEAACECEENQRAVVCQGVLSPVVKILTNMAEVVGSLVASHPHEVIPPNLVEVELHRKRHWDSQSLFPSSAQLAVRVYIISACTRVLTSICIVPPADGDGDVRIRQRLRPHEVAQLLLCMNQITVVPMAKSLYSALQSIHTAVRSNGLLFPLFDSIQRLLDVIAYLLPKAGEDIDERLAPNDLMERLITCLACPSQGEVPAESSSHSEEWVTAQIKIRTCLINCVAKLIEYSTPCVVEACNKGLMERLIENVLWAFYSSSDHRDGQSVRGNQAFVLAEVAPSAAWFLEAFHRYASEGVRGLLDAVARVCALADVVRAVGDTHVKALQASVLGAAKQTKAHRMKFQSEAAQHTSGAESLKQIAKRLDGLVMELFTFDTSQSSSPAVVACSEQLKSNCILQLYFIWSLMDAVETLGSKTNYLNINACQVRSSGLGSASERLLEVLHSFRLYSVLYGAAFYFVDPQTELHAEMAANIRAAVGHILKEMATQVHTNNHTELLCIYEILDSHIDNGVVVKHMTAITEYVVKGNPKTIDEITKFQLIRLFAQSLLIHKNNHDLKDKLSSLIEKILEDNNVRKQILNANNPDYLLVEVLFKLVTEPRLKKFALSQLRALLTVSITPTEGNTNAYSILEPVVRRISESLPLKELTLAGLAISRDAIVLVRDILSDALSFEYHQLAAGTGEFASKRRKDFQQMLREQDGFLHLVSILHSPAKMKLQEFNVSELVVEVLDALRLLMTNNAKMRKAFADLVGYVQLGEVLVHCLNGKISPAVTDSLLRLALEVDSRAAQNEFQPRYYIRNEMVLQPLFEMILHDALQGEVEWRRALIEELCKLICSSPHNLLMAASVDTLEYYFRILPAFDDAHVRENVAECLHAIGRQGITVAHLKAVFTLLREQTTEMRSQLLPYCIRLLPTTGNKKGASPVSFEPSPAGSTMLWKDSLMPRAFFHLDGVASGVKLPVLTGWPSKNGYSIMIWVRIETFGHSAYQSYAESSPLNQKRKFTPCVCSFLSSDGVGFELLFCDQRLAYYAHGKQQPPHVFDYPFKEDEWYHLVLTHSGGNVISNSELRLFVNGKPQGKATYRYPKLKGDLKYNLVGTTMKGWKKAVMTHHLFGQFTAIYLIDDVVSPERVQLLYTLGPNYISTFAPSERPPLVQNAIDWGLLFDGQFSSKILAAFNPLARDGKKLFNIIENTSGAKQEAHSASDPSLAPGAPLLAYCGKGTLPIAQTTAIQSLDCVSGVPALFPFITFLIGDLSEMDSTVPMARQGIVPTLPKDVMARAPEVISTVLTIMCDMLQMYPETIIEIAEYKICYVLHFILYRFSTVLCEDILAHIYSLIHACVVAEGIMGPLRRHVSPYIEGLRLLMLEMHLWCNTDPNVMLKIPHLLLKDCVNTRLMSVALREAKALPRVLDDLPWYFSSPHSASEQSGEYEENERKSMDCPVRRTRRGLLRLICKIITHGEPVNVPEAGAIVKSLMIWGDVRLLADGLACVAELLGYRGSGLADQLISNFGGLDVFMGLCLKPDREVRRMCLLCIGQLLLTTRKYSDLLSSDRSFGFSPITAILKTHGMDLQLYRSLRDIMLGRIVIPMSVDLQPFASLESTVSPIQGGAVTPLRIDVPCIVGCIFELLCTAKCDEVTRSCAMKDFVFLAQRHKENAALLLKIDDWQSYVLNLVLQDSDPSCLVYPYSGSGKGVTLAQQCLWFMAVMVTEAFQRGEKGWAALFEAISWVNTVLPPRVRSTGEGQPEGMDKTLRSEAVLEALYLNILYLLTFDQTRLACSSPSLACLATAVEDFIVGDHHNTKAFDASLFSAFDDCSDVQDSPTRSDRSGSPLYGEMAAVAGGVSNVLKDVAGAIRDVTVRRKKRRTVSHHWMTYDETAHLCYGADGQWAHRRLAIETLRLLFAGDLYKTDDFPFDTTFTVSDDGEDLSANYFHKGGGARIALRLIRLVLTHIGPFRTARRPAPFEKYTAGRKDTPMECAEVCAGSVLTPWEIQDIELLMTFIMLMAERGREDDTSRFEEVVPALTGSPLATRAWRLLHILNLLLGFGHLLMSGSEAGTGVYVSLSQRIIDVAKNILNQRKKMFDMMFGMNWTNGGLGWLVGIEEQADTTQAFMQVMACPKWSQLYQNKLAPAVAATVRDEAVCFRDAALRQRYFNGQLMANTRKRLEDKDAFDLRFKRDQSKASEAVEFAKLFHTSPNIGVEAAIAHRCELLRTGEKFWRQAIKSVTDERGVWRSPAPERTFVRMDFVEQGFHMHVKLKRDPCGTSHDGAADRSTMKSMSPEQSKQVFELTQKLVRQDKEVDDIIEDTEPEIDDDWAEVELKEEDDTKHTPSEQILISTPCEVVYLMYTWTATLEINTFQLCVTLDEENKSSTVSPVPSYLEHLLPRPADERLPLETIGSVWCRRFRMQRTGIEFFFVSGASLFLTFASPDMVKKVLNALYSAPKQKIQKMKRRSYAPDKEFKKAKFTERWMRREMPTFDYLMALNIYAGRSNNDLTQYPVFPWVLKDYTSEEIDLTDEKVYRDLSQPMGATGAPSRKAEVLERYSQMVEMGMEPFHYGSHYSSLGVVLYYLARIEPFTSMLVLLQNGKFDHADRMFHSVIQTWANVSKTTSDVKELIPEFYYLPEMFLNNNNVQFGVKQDGTRMDTSVLPPWAKGDSPEARAHAFVRIMKEALESDYVSAHIHEWIDLIFGFKQRGKNAVAAINVFHPLTYEGKVNWAALTDPAERASVISQIDNFGQTPIQLFRSAHPRRDVPSERIYYPFVHNPLLLNPGGPAYSIARDTAIVKVYFHMERAVFITSNGSVIIHRVTFPPLYMLGQVKAILADHKLKTISQSAATEESTDIATVSRARWSTHSIRSTLDSPILDVSPAPIAPQVVQQLKRNVVSSVVFHLAAESRTKPVLGEVSRLDVGNSTFAMTQTEKGDMILFAAGLWDNTAKVITLANNNTSVRVVQALTGHQDIVTCVSVSQDNSTVITGSRDTTCIVWAVNQEKFQKEQGRCCTQRYKLFGHNEEVTCTAVSLTLDIVVSGSKDGTVIIHSAGTGQYERTLHHPDRHPVDIAALVTHQYTIVMFSREDQILHLFSINGGRLRSADAMCALQTIMPTRDSRFLICGGALRGASPENTLVIRGAGDLSVVRRFSASASVRSVCLHRDNQVLAAGLEDGTVQFYTVQVPQG